MGQTVDPRTTIIYYTANREEERFEQVIRQQIIRAAGGLPIISVSQKPIDFGQNICVGDVGISNQNAHRQFQIGCEAAKTEYVHAAESDTLYPPEYFQFVPDDPLCAYRTPIYLFRFGGTMFYRKKGSESATVCGRDYAIYAVNKSLRNRGTWRDSLEQGREVPYTFRHGNWKPFVIETSIVNIKTPNQMHSRHGYDETVKELPYWGKPEEVTRLFL
jgi:hypothetical protein